MSYNFMELQQEADNGSSGGEGNIFINYFAEVPISIS